MKYILGIDMGTTSLGWSVLSLDKENKINSLIDMGVRIFPDGRNSKDLTPLSVERREKRGMRRNLDRRKISLIYNYFRVTMYHMKTETINIRIDDSLSKMLKDTCSASGKSKSEIARKALEKELKIQTFKNLRNEILPYAEKNKFISDEDVDKQVS